MLASITSIHMVSLSETAQLAANYGHVLQCKFTPTGKCLEILQIPFIIIKDRELSPSSFPDEFRAGLISRDNDSD